MGETVKFTFNLPPELLKVAQRRARSEGRSLAWLLRRALKDYVEHGIVNNKNWEEKDIS